MAHQTTMTQQDRKFFEEMGLIKSKVKTKSWSLVYRMGNREEGIISNKPYSLCQFKKNQLKSQPQYISGELVIKPA